MRDFIALFFILIGALSPIMFGLYSSSNKPKQSIQAVQIIQGNDTTVCTGIVDDTQYYVKVFDTLGSIKCQVRGNFKINYLNK